MVLALYSCILSCIYYNSYTEWRGRGEWENSEQKGFFSCLFSLPLEISRDEDCQLWIFLLLLYSELNWVFLHRKFPQEAYAVLNVLSILIPRCILSLPGTSDIT